MFNLCVKAYRIISKTLENEREKERFILEAFKDGVILYDNDLSVISINRAGLKRSALLRKAGALTVPEGLQKPEMISGAEKSSK